MSDIVIVGAGLSGLLTAWRCLRENPDIHVTIVDAADHIAGDHTWSFNLSDISTEDQAWLKPLIAHEWPRYSVKFPKRQRTLEIPYASGHSDSLRAAVKPLIASGRLIVRLNSEVKALRPDHVELLSGETIYGRYVLDARGYDPDENVFLGYQKFVGKTIRTKEPHGLEYPIIMDATVAQYEGYRFVYCLPFSDREMLVEDTYYTDGQGLDTDSVLARIDTYIAAQDWVVERVLRQESGVLPITLAVDGRGLDKTRDQDPDYVPEIGIRGGFYHAVTGYSLPQAVRVASEISAHIQKDRVSNLPSPIPIRDMMQNHRKNEAFFRLLNRMLFRAAKPQERYKVLERFYGLSESLIRRFYASQLSGRDKMRILSGKPPVPITKAMYNLSEASFIRRERDRNREL